MAKFQIPFFRSRNAKVEANFTKGIFHLQEGNYATAAALFENAAEAGHVSALFNLCLIQGSGFVSPWNFDVSADHWYKAAALGHPSAKETLYMLEAADRGGFGIGPLVTMTADNSIEDGITPGRIMTCAARYFGALCKKYGATNDVIAYELDILASNERTEFKSFLTRTGVPEIFFIGGSKRLIMGSAAHQVIDCLNQFNRAQIKSGVAISNARMSRCAIVGYIIQKSLFGGSSEPLLGFDKFFSLTDSIVINSNKSDNSRHPQNDRGLRRHSVSPPDKFSIATQRSDRIEEGKRLFEAGMRSALAFQADSALEYYTKSIEAAENPSPYINRANLLAKRMRHFEAEQDLLKANEIDLAQGMQFQRVLARELAAIKVFTHSYTNGLAGKLVIDLEERGPQFVAERIICTSFDISQVQWDYVDCATPIFEFHLFNDLDNIVKFDDIRRYPEAQELVALYPSAFIEMKVKSCPNARAYEDVEARLYSLLCSYPESDTILLRRHIISEMHKRMLMRDFDGLMFLALDSDCKGVIKEAEAYLS